MVLVKLLFACTLTIMSLTAKAQSSNSSQRAQQSLERCQYRHAAELFEQLIANKEQGVEYALHLAGYAEAIQTTDFNKADSLYVESLAILDKAEGQEANYARVLQNLVEVRMTLQKNDEVEQMLDKVLTIKAKEFGKQSVEYAEAWSLLGWHYAVGSKFKQANEIIDQALVIATSKAPNTFLHGVILHRTTLLAFYGQNYTKAEELSNQSKAIFDKTCPPSHRKVIESGSSLAMLYAQTRRMEQARKLIVELLPLIEREYGRQDYVYSILLSTLGSIYAFEGDVHTALPMFEESIAQNKRLFGELHGTYFSALNNLAMLYTRVDDFEKAEAILVESMRIRKQLYGESSSHYIQALNSLATLYQSMGNYERTLEFHFRAMELSKVVLGESSKNYILAQTNVALAYLRGERYEKALEYANLSEQTMSKHNLGDKSEFTELRASNILIKIRCGEFDGKSVAKVIETAEQIKGLYGEKNITYQNIINALSLYYLKEHNYEPALKFAILENRLTKTYRAKDSYAYLASLSNIGVAYYRMGQMEQAESALRESVEVTKELALKNFVFMSNSEREKYWLLLQSTMRLIDEFSAIAIAKDCVTHSVVELIYNTTLFTKALLLNYSTNIQQSIARSGNIELTSTWELLRKLKTTTIQDSTQVGELERKLALLSKPYQQQVRDISIQWSDIRDKLEPGEAAVEIISIPEYGNSRILHYYALFLRPEYDHPQLVYLCDEADIKETLLTPLNTHLTGVGRFYIAGAGLTNRISFTALKQDGTYVMDRYSMYNILSTRDIIRIKEQQKRTINSITLFGGADFALSTSELSASNAAQSPRIDLSRGQGFDYLPGSKKEVVEIGNMLRKRGWESTTHTDANATETQFKNLSSISTDVIHVATHGYYFPLKGSVNNQTNSFQQSNDPLIRSGLLFSGANNIWSNKAQENLTDDGVLTGYEISMMELTRTKLVVLSACNTALGDINYLEGVYGLQRAFRMAGAESILVSLWEISDRETILFMKSFYTNLSSGESIREAFDKTIREIRSANPSKPKLWAGFVLIE